MCMYAIYRSCIYILLTLYNPAAESLYSTKRDGYMKQKIVKRKEGVTRTYNRKSIFQTTPTSGKRLALSIFASSYT